MLKEANQDQRAELVRLVQWSQAALLWALSPDDLLCGHKQEPPEVTERLRVTRIRYYKLQLLSLAARAVWLSAGTGVHPKLAGAQSSP